MLRPFVTTSERHGKIAEGAVTAVYCGIVIFFAIVFIRYSLGAFIAFFNSDSAANVLFAQEMIAQHTPFPQWNNSTGICFPLIMPNLAVLPFVLAFVSDWFTAFRIAVIIDQTIMFGLIWWVLRRAGLSRVGRLFVIAFLLIGPSLPFVLQTTLLAGKSWLFAFILLLAHFARQLGEADSTRARWRWIALLVGVGGLIFVDYANAATIIPGLCAALVAQWLASKDDGSRVACISAVAALLASAVLGQLIASILLRGSDYTPFEVGFRDLSEAGDHLRLLLRGMIELFGAVPATGASPYSLAGAASGAKFVVLLTILGAPVYFALRYDVLQNSSARLLAVTCSVSLVIRIYIYLFTGISVGLTGTARYFIVELLLGIVVCLFYLEQRVRERWVRDLMVLALVVPFALTSSLRAQSAGAPTKGQALAAQLATAGLDFGYASFWNANAPTAISSGKIKVRQIEFGGGTIKPMRWLSSDRWYMGDPVARQSFLLLNAEELKNADLSALRAMIGDPERSVDITGFTALVYPFDLATRLGWGHAMDHPLDPAQMRVEVTLGNSPRLEVGKQALLTEWHVRNLGSAMLTSFGKYPVNLGLHLKDANGAVINRDLARQSMPPLLAGQSTMIHVTIPLNQLKDGMQIEADLVQEGVAWFGDRGSTVARLTVSTPAPASEAAGQGDNVIPIKQAPSQRPNSKARTHNRRRPGH